MFQRHFKAVRDAFAFKLCYKQCVVRCVCVWHQPPWCIISTVVPVFIGVDLYVNQHWNIKSLTFSPESSPASKQELIGGVSDDPSIQTHNRNTSDCDADIKALGQMKWKAGVWMAAMPKQSAVGAKGLPSQISLCRRAACQLADCWGVLSDSLHLHWGTQSWGALSHQILEYPSLPSSA